MGSQDRSINEWFFDLYDRMLGGVEIPLVLREVADVVCDDRSAERATIYLINPETQELESVAVIGNVARMIRVPICEDSLAGYCAVHRKAFVVPDAYGDLSAIDPKLTFDRSWDELNAFRTRDVMCAPALFKDDLVGVVQVVNSRGDPFSTEDLPPLQSVSRPIGYALYHARIYDDLATMKRLEKEKASFMRIMVHELKSPVAAIKMMADMLRQTAGDDPKVTHMAGRISQRTEDMLHLVRDLLELARIKSGQVLGKVAVLDLAEQTRSACEPYQDQAAAKGVALSLTLPRDPVPVRLDSKGCNLILSNLISNAVKYTESGSVDVSVGRADDWAILTVSDTGMGIPEADIPKLFTEFFRAGNAKKSHIPGTGVGLAGVRQIVERFGGQMELQSVEGQGSTFTVRLPVHSA